MQNWHPLPAGVYSVIEQTPASVLLESAARGTPSLGAQVSRLFLGPAQILVPRTRAEVDECLVQIETAAAGGQFAAGFMTYECGTCFEPRAGMRGPHHAEPLAWFGIYDRCYTWDHMAGKFVGVVPPEFNSSQRTHHEDAGTATVVGSVSLALTESEYAARIAAIHEWIRAGDVYQLNFTLLSQFQAPEQCAALYAELRRRQPVEYGAYIHWEQGRHILSFSPELFFRIDRKGESRHMTTRPMKGTARRGRTTAEDRNVAQWLQNDLKNRSENVMIVDLLRNDLGRLCEFGTIAVSDLFAVERHPTLWQMTSTVSGALRQGVSFGDVVRALFPSGSVTGAPKIRAMQLLAELEVQPRGVYTGMIGFLSAQEAVASVAIRTVEVEGRSAKMGVGSGIVIDSDAREEYQECRLKSQFLTERTPHFELIETMLWRGAFPLLELHLDRLEDSADYFGFEFDRAEAQSRLMAAGTAMRDAEARKIRMLLSPDGSLTIGSELLPGPSAAPLRVCIASERTDAADKFYFHKTTNRPLYRRALRAAQEAGFDDVLFLNLEGQVTESALGNVFLEKDGQLFTPPAACGLLAGVFRRHLMETRGDVVERVLWPEDVKAADRVYLSNAVRGLRAVDFRFTGEAFPSA
ncbi:MAG TPA: aminodeoxychorismate synthase component I [Terracidiphilus sp.]|jgi:para-aminobenzoate synthetase/4-amino-4-deoxychorismate lyase